MLSPNDRLKLARDDFDQQEKLYGTLVLGLRFYIGTASLLGGWSLTLWKGTGPDAGGWRYIMAAFGILFWGVLLAAVYQLFLMTFGADWAFPRALDQYLASEKEHLAEIKSGTFNLGDMSPEEVAEEAMLLQMVGAYADSATVNRTANMVRQRRLTITGRTLLVAVVCLGLQGGAGIIAQHHGNPEPAHKSDATPAATATATPAGPSGPGEAKR